MKNKFKPDNKKQLFLLPPNIEDFIPQTHLARLIDEVVKTIDTSTIEDKYSQLGQKSYHPKLLLKIWIYSYATGIFSGRKIASKCETDTAYMFLSSMYRPDFRTINDFRKNNLEVFSTCFIQVLNICRKMNMGHVGTIAVDSTKIRANASVKKTKDKRYYQSWLQQTEEELKKLHKKADVINTEEEKQYGNNRGDELMNEIQDKEQLRKKIQEAIGSLNDSEKLNWTDTDAKLIRSKGKIDCHYNCQGASSMDGIIVTANASAQVNDREQLIEVIEQVESNSNEKVKTILADSGYSSYDVYEKLHNKNIDAYMPDQEIVNRSKRDYPSFHPTKFSYNQQKDYYICPQQKQLLYHKVSIRKKYKQQYKVYKGIECDRCPVKTDCTSSTYRTIQREFREDLRQQARDRLSSEEGRKKYQLRMHTIEPIWANIKFNRNFKMFSLRGLKKVDAEFKLMCTAMNILKIHSKLKIKIAA